MRLFEDHTVVLSQAIFPLEGFLELPVVLFLLFHGLLAISTSASTNIRLELVAGRRLIILMIIAINYTSTTIISIVRLCNIVLMEARQAGHLVKCSASITI